MANEPPVEEEPPPEEEAPVSLRRSFADALAANDVPRAVTAALTAVRTGDMSVPALYEQVLGPVLADIGAAWQHGREHVWQEHLASAAVRTVVESLYLDVQNKAAAVSPRGQVAVLACPTAERHDLGLRMLADRLTLAGWTVHFLGASVPDAEIVQAAGTLQAHVVVLTVATHFNLLGLRTTVAHVKEQLPSVTVLVGGPAFGPEEDWPAEELLSEQDLGVAHDAARKR